MQLPVLITILQDGFSFELIFVEGGEFLMGDDNSDYDAVKPAHWVQIPSFYLGKFQVTQAFYKAVMRGKNPSRFNSDNRPVEEISWDDARDFLKALNAETGKPFHLPSEAEWEYAARGGQYSQGYTYAGSDRLKQVGWYNKNSVIETKTVGSLLPNELGLYDSGNVLEWCEDDWHGNYKGAPSDGSPWVDSPGRGVKCVLRGGGYFSLPEDCFPSSRDGYAPDYRYDDLGFRLALSLQLMGIPDGCRKDGSTEQANDPLPACMPGQIGGRKATKAAVLVA